MPHTRPLQSCSMAFLLRQAVAAVAARGGGKNGVVESNGVCDVKTNGGSLGIFERVREKVCVLCVGVCVLGGESSGAVSGNNPVWRSPAPPPPPPRCRARAWWSGFEMLPSVFVPTTSANPPPPWRSCTKGTRTTSSTRHTSTPCSPCNRASRYPNGETRKSSAPSKVTVVAFE